MEEIKQINKEKNRRFWLVVTMTLSIIGMYSALGAIFTISKMYIPVLVLLVVIWMFVAHSLINK